MSWTSSLTRPSKTRGGAMEVSPVKFLSIFLVVSSIGWVIFTFAARMIAWILSRSMGATVQFQVAGCNCARDVSIKFNKGSIESVTIGEIKLSFRKSLVKLGCSVISRDPKLQLLISDLEVVLREPQAKKKTVASRRSRSAGRGKWIVVSNVMKYISVSINEFVVQMPKTTFEIKELNFDTFKERTSPSSLGVKLHLLPCNIILVEKKAAEQENGFQNMSPMEEMLQDVIDKNLATLFLEELLIICHLRYTREAGINVKSIQGTCGEMLVNLNEDMFSAKNVNKKSENLGLNRESDYRVDDGIEINKTGAVPREKPPLLSIKKNMTAFPENVSFSLPKLSMKCMYKSKALALENYIMGINLQSKKSHISDDMGDSTSHFDIQMDFSEIHCLKEGDTSILEILKVAVTTSLDISKQLSMPVRAEVDIKLGGTLCNLVTNRLKPWMELYVSHKMKEKASDSNLKVKSDSAKRRSSKMKAIMWTCTFSAPETSVVLYNFNNTAVFHGCSQSSHLFANNITSESFAVHMELGELQLNVAAEGQSCQTGSLFGLETNSGSLLHISRISLDWGNKDAEMTDNDKSVKRNMTFSTEISGSVICLSLHRVQSVLSTISSFAALMKSVSSLNKRLKQKKATSNTRNGGKGAKVLKLNIEKFLIKFAGDLLVENSAVVDPKKVNYGSQGGEVIITEVESGKRRMAEIKPAESNAADIPIQYVTSLDIYKLSIIADREKKSTEIELERGRLLYEEFSEDKLSAELTLFFLQNSRIVYQAVNATGNRLCSLVSATDVNIHWEPDVHLAFYETFLKISLFMAEQKNKDHVFLKENFNFDNSLFPEEGKSKIADLESSHVAAQHQKKNTKTDFQLAIDIENLSMSAGVGDGVVFLLKVQSIFSEDARIGILLEHLDVSLNHATILKSNRLQISRIPSISANHRGSNSQCNSAGQLPVIWDFIIQGFDVHIIMPYRLELRAIDDAIEDMIRGLKLIMAAKKQSLSVVPKVKERSSSKNPFKIGSVKFHTREIVAEIEEEPIQGWLDEHYKLMRNEVSDLFVRLRKLDELVAEISAAAEAKEHQDSKILKELGELNTLDGKTVVELKEKLYKQAFRSYYKACQNIVHSEGSGACAHGFQSGFKPSVHRRFVLAIQASNLEVVLTDIDGGRDGMIEMIRKLDNTSADSEIPFSRILGRNFSLTTNTLMLKLRNYSYPMLSASMGKCEGTLIFAQQATVFPPQITQEIYVGRWHKVQMMRSMSGTTPPLKFYSYLPIQFNKAEVAYGVGYEPVLADVSYAFTVALRRANLSVRKPGPLPAVVKKEKNLPWWDDMRYYIHGQNSIHCSEIKLISLATTDPYEQTDKMQIIANDMYIQQSDGHITVSSKEFKGYLSSLEHLLRNVNVKLSTDISGCFLTSPSFHLDVTLDWECDSGRPMNHYLHALPIEAVLRDRLYDPFRSTSLSLRFNFSLKPPEVEVSTEDSHSFSQFGVPVRKSTAKRDSYDCTSISPTNKSEAEAMGVPTVNLGAHDLLWLFKWWNMVYIPPHKLRSFARWPRFGVPRFQRSGNLSLDKVMTEFMLRVDATPSCIRHVPLRSDDPANGLTFSATKLKYEFCFSRGIQTYTFDCKRDPLDLVYQGLDLHMLKAELKNTSLNFIAESIQKSKRLKHLTSLSEGVAADSCQDAGVNADTCNEEGFLFSTDFFTIRKQSPKVDPERLLSWQEAGRSTRSLETPYERPEYDYGSENDAILSDPSDDDGFSFVLADNCQRVFVYGLKLLWTIKNRDAVWAWVGEISKAFETPKPSPSRQYAQRKMMEKQKKLAETEKNSEDPSCSTSPKCSKSVNAPSSPPSFEKNVSPFSPPTKPESSLSAPIEEEGTMNFMVNVIQPQFNLHAEEASGRFLLAAASGRVLARSFHSVLHVGYEMIEEALGEGALRVPGSTPEMTWKRRELSVMLEHVQAHVAPTDVDPGAGLQWLPRIPRSSPKFKRTGPLLERVFMPCSMYFQYTRHKGGTSDLKMKPLKELSFNSPNITATMTSRQFQVMVDIISNLLLARLPKPRKSSLSGLLDEEEGDEEVTDEVVPDGVEEVELARIEVEKFERECKLILDDMRTIAMQGGYGSAIEADLSPEKTGSFWMMYSGRPAVVDDLTKELVNKHQARKSASLALRLALQRAAHQRLMEKEKNKSPSFAMRISWAIDKVVWTMLSDGKAFAEAEISNMKLNVDRDYKDVGVAEFTTRSFVVRNCLPNAKSDMLLCAWNPPPEWGRNVMLRVNAKQGAPKDGNSPLELFQVEIYPLKIYLTETMYKMMWEYLFPEEEQDSQRRQEVWKVSTTAGSKRGKKMHSSFQEQASSSNNKALVGDGLSRANASGIPLAPVGAAQSALHNDPTHLSFLMAAQVLEASKHHNQKGNLYNGPSEHHRAVSMDKTMEESASESACNDLLLHTHSSSLSSKGGPFNLSVEQQASGVSIASTSIIDIPKNKSKDTKSNKPGRISHEDKKLSKSQEEKKDSRARKTLEFYNIKISQVELLVTYEGSRLAVNDLRLLMDTFSKSDFTGTWRRLFSRVKKHIIWGVLKSVAGMQGRKFKDKAHAQKQVEGGASDSDLNFSDSDGSQTAKYDQFPISWTKKPIDRAGEGFVTQIRGLFNSQRRKAKAFVMRTVRGDAENEFHGEWSDTDTEHPFARQLTITKARKLIQRHTKKFRPSRTKGVPFPSSSKTTPFQSEGDSSSVSSAYEDFHD